MGLSIISMKRLTSDCLMHTTDYVYGHKPLNIAIYVIVCLFWGDICSHMGNHWVSAFINVLIFIFFPQVTCKSWHFHPSTLDIINHISLLITQE